ncbi:unnamed protein product [Kluyveromyces dobzhanskii CBS 2104]|uniref:GTP-binding protein RHO4 n=1 Tax=Kluyveromyces dobzhanskii CBS 2104 TaxID=1427455 RepID=A0A0A8LD75_9SACH|nr:unnamed protein product [Kluyveromyces dobzhanskii CBS 2104]
MKLEPGNFKRTLGDIPHYSKSVSKGGNAQYHLKIVVVGDGAVGKTSLLISYTQGKFPEDYVPTIFENYITNLEGPNGKIVELALWDTAGQEEYSRLRPLSYTDVDILMICYAVNSNVSFYNIEEMWVPEVKHFCPEVPIMIVGLKSDLYAEDNISDFVDSFEAEEMAKRVGAFVHLQCSSKSQQKVREVFDTAITAALYDELKPKKKFRSHRKCVVL